MFKVYISVIRGYSLGLITGRKKMVISLMNKIMCTHYAGSHIFEKIIRSLVTKSKSLTWSPREVLIHQNYSNNNMAFSRNSTVNGF